MSNINAVTSHQFSFSQFGNNNKLTPPFNIAQFCHGLAPEPFGVHPSSPAAQLPQCHY